VSDLTALLVALLLLAGNAFFVGAEFALISVRRTQIEPRVATGSRVARITLRAMENVTLVMAGAQFGITACSLGLGAIGEPAVAHLLEPVAHAAGIPDDLLHPIAFAVALGLVVYLHVVLGEMVPKNIALAGATRAALVLGPPMMVVVTVLKPIVVGLNAIANGVLRLVHIEPKDEVASSYTRDQVAAMVDEARHEGLLGADEYDRLAGALGFTERTVDTVLLPRETLVTVPVRATVLDIEAVCADTGYSRFPVVTEEGDLTGYLHIKDVLEADPAIEDHAIDAKWIRPFATVRGKDRLHDALAALRQRGAHMGRVVRDDGSLVGIITLEDVLEELVGEIRDAAHT
jgi:CBS domain containing-hemolysin-like protein